MYITGAKPALGPNCMIPYIKKFGPKTGLAPVMYITYNLDKMLTYDARRVSLTIIYTKSSYVKHVKNVHKCGKHYSLRLFYIKKLN